MEKVREEANGNMVIDLKLLYFFPHYDLLSG